MASLESGTRSWGWGRWGGWCLSSVPWGSAALKTAGSCIQPVSAVCAKSLQSRLTLYDPMDCSPPPGSSVHGILQARILEWVAMPSSRDLPDPGIKNMSLTSCALAYRFFSTSTTWEAQYWYCSISTVSAEDWVNFIGQRDLNITKHRLIFSMT